MSPNDAYCCGLSFQRGKIEDLFESRIATPNDASVASAQHGRVSVNESTE